MPNTPAERSTPMGFAGLAELVSNIDEPLEAPVEAAPPEEPAAPEPPAGADLGLALAPLDEAAPGGGGQPLRPVPVPARAQEDPGLALVLQDLEESAAQPEASPHAYALLGLEPPAGPGEAPAGRGGPSVFVANADRRPLAEAPRPEPRKPAPPAPPKTPARPAPPAKKKRPPAGGPPSPLLTGLLAALGLAGILFLIGDIFLARQQKPLAHYLSLLQDAAGLSKPAAPAAKPAPAIAHPRVEEKPPAGENLMLGQTQLRYCLAEKLRMSEIGHLVDPKSLGEVKEYNAWVADFNARCASFRYDPALYDAISQHVQQDQEDLKAEAQKRLAALREAKAGAQPPAGQ